MTRVGVCLVRISLLLSFGLLLRAATSDAACTGFDTTLSWPGPPPCDGTLQACVDALPCNRGALEIAADSDEAISFQKGLTLRAAAGHTPVLTGFMTGGPPTDTVAVKPGYLIQIEGLTFQGAGGVGITQDGPYPVTVRIDGNTFDSWNGIQMQEGASGSGAVSFDVSQNAMTVSVDPMRGVGWGIVVTTADGWGGSVAHNRIAMEPNNGLGSAISVGGAGTFGADVIANYISGKGYGSGIYVSQSIGAPGTITTRILGNLVVGDPTGPGASYAIDLVGGTATFVVDVADNTVADDVDGIDLVGTTVSGEVANNIVSGNTYSGISIAPALAATVPNKNNLVYGDGMESFTPGPGTVSLDPRYAGGGDYHLLPDSPAIDAGASSAVPSDLLTDLDGNPRIQGHRVDIGAYEAPEPTGALGGGAALLALAGAVRSRRRSTRASERSA